MYLKLVNTGCPTKHDYISHITILLPFNILYCSLWYQTIQQIVEEDISNNSPIVTFRWTHCRLSLLPELN